MAKSPQTTSVTIPEQNVFAHLQLRSATPAANEKVLQFLHGMAQGEQPNTTPPRSLVDPDEYSKPASVLNGIRSPRQVYSPVPRSKASETLLNTGMAGIFSPKKDFKVNGFIEEIKGDDVDSNIQDGVRSELGETKAREPGPDDLPGPKYISYGSGPSFGNFGPLPPDELPTTQNLYGSWNPVWSDIISAKQQAMGQEDQTPPNNGAKASGPTSPRTQSRAPSRATIAKGDPDHLLSPRSVKSKLATDRGADSGMDMYADVPASPSKSRARKAASLSPSDSPSQRVPKSLYANGNRPSPPGSLQSAALAQNRPFSPYRHAPTHEDLLNAAVRGRSLVLPPSPDKTPSLASSKHERPPSIIQDSKASSRMSVAKAPSVGGSKLTPGSTSSRKEQEGMLSRAQSPDVLDAEEARIVSDALAARTPRTSLYGGTLRPDDTEHYHDMEVCVLLHEESAPQQHEFVKKALRKAIRQRIKKLGIKYDQDSIKQFKKNFHDHDPIVHAQSFDEFDNPPSWAADLKRELVLMQQRIESLGPKIDNLRNPDMSFNEAGSRFVYAPDESAHTPMTRTVNIQTQPTGTLADSMYQPRETELLLDDDEQLHDYDDMTEGRGHIPQTDGETRSLARSTYESEPVRNDSPGRQFLEEELFKLRQKPTGDSVVSHNTWELARHNEDEDNEGTHASRPLPELPSEAGRVDDMAVQRQEYQSGEYTTDGGTLTPWQRIHSRLLSWAIIWPTSELENALNSTTRGQQVDEVALSVWSTQTYKRYVRTKLTDSPRGQVDRLVVPPNMADAINNAVYNGRHGDACGMLKDLWSPFGLEGIPRLIVVLAKHRSDPNHWVVHRFSLPDGNLTTYDSYPERTLPDGRPLGWWFAIRVAWPLSTYPNPDNLVQKMVRLHRPMQLPIDNSVAAAGIWRNVLMGSRAERSLDLERLRDLINTEVKNLKQRKQLGKLSIAPPRTTWQE